MWKIAGPLFLILSTLVIGCSEKDSTAPEPGDDYTLEGTETIGPGGGTFEIEDFSLTVPAGAFDADYELELYASTEDRPFGDNGVSRMFRVEGLPTEYLQPLRVSIKYEGALSESRYVATGEEVFAPSLSELTTAYLLLAASDSSGWLVSELPWPGGPTGPHATGASSSDPQSPSSFNTNLGAVSSELPVTSPGGHFLIEYSPVSVDRANVDALAGFLEEAYTVFRNSLGFTFIDTARTRWPVDVTVKPLDSEVYGYSVCSHLGDNYGWMEFNSAKMGDLTQMRSTAGHEFFHLVQSLYDPRNRVSKARWAPDHYWLNEATAVWSEERFTDQQNYISPIRDNNEMAPFNGMEKGAEEGAKYHGYGMSAVIKYLITEYGEDILVAMYQRIRQESSPVLAVTSSTEDPIVWLERFFREYVLGNIYGVGVVEWLGVGGTHGKFTIDSDDDTLKTFSDAYPDLSARLYKIDLSYPDIDSTAAITFSATGGGNEITVFKYRSIVIECVAYDVDHVSVPNVRALTDEGSHLLVLVTNSRHVPPYTGTSDIDLTIRVTEAPEDLPHNRCSISGHVFGHFRVVYPDDTSEEVYERCFIGVMQTLEGGFSGNTFTGIGAESGYQGTVTATLDVSRAVITNVNWTETHPTSGTYDIAVSGINIPMYGELDYTPLTYKVEGVETSNHISSLEKMFKTGMYFDTEHTLIDYECDANSGVAIQFWEE